MRSVHTSARSSSPSHPPCLHPPSHAVAPCITKRSTQKDMRVQAARMTHRGGSRARTCKDRERVHSRGVRISPSEGSGRIVGTEVPLLDLSHADKTV